MKLAMIAMVCVSFLLAGAARADLEPGTYAPDIEAEDWLNTDGQPISLAECRGMIVVLFFWVPWHEGGESIMPLMTLVNSSQYGRSAGVFVIGLTDAERSRVEKMLEKEKVFFPVGMEAKESFEDFDIDSYPRVVVIDAAGKVGWTGWPGQGGGLVLVNEIGKVAGATPPWKTHPDEAVKSKEYLGEAKEALGGGNYDQAFKSAKSAYDHALRGDPLKTRCEELLDLIQTLGRDRLARADQAVEKEEYEQAVALLLDLRKQFRGVEAARSATRRIKALKKEYEQIAEILQEKEDANVAETTLASAMDQIRAREFGPAHEQLREIVKSYSETEAAAKAQTIIERMHKNEGVMGYVRDYQASGPCETLLSQAEAYERTGRADRARELYRKIIEDYPDTIYADQAARRVARLL